MFSNILKSAATASALLATTACNSLDKVQTSGTALAGSTDVTAVSTEHSIGLQCLGALINDAGRGPIVIEVDSIRDRTIPARINDPTRLSQASEWLVVTAISKMETPYVKSTLKNDHKNLPVKPAFKLHGAWTQDDEVLRQTAGLGDLEWLTGRLKLTGERRYDLIAGDFVSEKDGIIEFSTAIGVILGSNDVGARLVVDDGVNSAEFGIDARWADGPQMAQRRIVEAATLIHVSRYFGIDYSPCLTRGLGDPERYRESLTSYGKMSKAERARKAQEKLAQLGYQTGPADGVWGQQSRVALMTFQSDQSLPVTGNLSPSVFAILETEPA